MVRDWLAEIAQDIAFATRLLRRRPAFTATVLLTLSLGIGATTAMFTVVNGVLLAPLPYREPGRLMSIYTTFPFWRGKPVVGVIWNTLQTAWPEYQQLIGKQRSFENIGALHVSNASLTVGTETNDVDLGSATANLLPVLGVGTARGRWFLPGEDGPGAPRVAVLSHELWQRRYGGNGAIVGSTVTIDEEPFTVIGVLPGGFSLAGERVEMRVARRADLWIPVGVNPRMLTPGNQSLELIGRLRRGVSAAAALADVEPLLRGNRAPDRRGARIVPRAEHEAGALRRPLILLSGAVGLLLLITCGNVATLFLSECAVRHPELRTRAVLGAGRGRLIRLLLVESGVIAAGGAAGGLVLAWWGSRALLSRVPQELPHAAMIHVDLRVAVFVAVVAAIVALLSGIVPALTFSRSDTMRAASAGRIAGGRSRLQTSVIALQAAMSIVLLADAGLLVWSVLNEQRVAPGFGTANMLTLRVSLPSSLLRTGADSRRLNDDVTRAILALPGVTHVASTSAVPLGGRSQGQIASPRPEEKIAQSGIEVERAAVSVAYFEVLHIPILAGRSFGTQDDDAAPPVAIVSEGFARRFWPGEIAIGKQFRHPNGVATVVGIAGDVKNKTLDRAPVELFYLPTAQTSDRLAFLVETRGDPVAAATDVSRAVWTTAPGSAISDVASMDALIAHALAPARYRALLAGIFALLALVITAIGVAGLTARSVAVRLRELCIHMALGATPRAALGLAVRGGLGAVAAGVLVGVVVTPFTSRWFADYLFEASSTDLRLHVGTGGIAILICLVATLLATNPLRRADLASVLRDL